MTRALVAEIVQKICHTLYRVQVLVKQIVVSLGATQGVFYMIYIDPPPTLKL